MRYSCGCLLLTVIRPLLSLLWMRIIAHTSISNVQAFHWNRVSRYSIPIFHSHHLHNHPKKYDAKASRITLPTLQHTLTRFDSCIMSTKVTTDTNDAINETTTAKEDLMEGLPHPLILGSASFTRKLILKQMGIDYHILVRPIDEKEVGYRDTDSPEALVQAVAQAKMNHLIQEIISGNCDQDLPPLQDNDNDTNGTEWIVFTADQVVTCEGRILEKPESITQAKEFVTQYGKHPCSTVGCVVMTHLPSRTSISGIHTATVHFLPTLTPEVASTMIDTLIEQNEPILSCAGGLMIEHPLTQQYVDRIEGNMDSVMGLCPETVRRLLLGLRASIR